MLKAVIFGGDKHFILLKNHPRPNKSLSISNLDVCEEFDRLKRKKLFLEIIMNKILETNFRFHVK